MYVSHRSTLRTRRMGRTSADFNTSLNNGGVYPTNSRFRKRDYETDENGPTADTKYVVGYEGCWKTGRLRLDHANNKPGAWVASSRHFAAVWLHVRRAALTVAPPRTNGGDCSLRPTPVRSVFATRSFIHMKPSWLTGSLVSSLWRVHTVPLPNRLEIPSLSCLLCRGTSADIQFWEYNVKDQ